jgi:hypothetical protein
MKAASEKATASLRDEDESDPDPDVQQGMRGVDGAWIRHASICKLFIAQDVRKLAILNRLVCHSYSCHLM